MQWLLLSRVSLSTGEPHSCVRSYVVSYENALVRGNADDVADSAVDDAFKYLHAVRQQRYRLVNCAIRGATLFLADPDWGAPLTVGRSLFLRDDLVEERSLQPS